MSDRNNKNETDKEVGSKTDRIGECKRKYTDTHKSIERPNTLIWSVY